MLLKPGSTTISEMRERRRERILRNADQRIRSILSGPDGTDVRNAPALEGGEGFKNLVHSSGTSVSNGEVTATSKSVTSSSNLTCAAISRLWKALFIGMLCGVYTITRLVRPFGFIIRLYESIFLLWISGFILEFILINGLIMRSAVSFLLIKNVVWPWIILYMVSTWKVLFQISSLHHSFAHFYPSRLHLGLNIDLLSHAGAIVQNIWCFIKESSVVALFFILFNAMFCIFALIFGECRSL